MKYDIYKAKAEEYIKEQYDSINVLKTLDSTIENKLYAHMHKIVMNSYDNDPNKINIARKENKDFLNRFIEEIR